MKRYATYLATNIETIPLGEANITITEKKWLLNLKATT
jgi:hypothetical protein